MNVNVSLHNRFDFTLTGPDGQVKQKAYAENLVTNNMFKEMYYRAASAWKYLYLGNGKGEPSVTDTALFNRVLTANFTGSEPKVKVGTLQEIDHNTCKIEYTAVLAASSSYVYDFTEIGLSGFNGLLTHAMIKDSEGNPITIHKTDLDELTIVATVYATWGSVPEGVKLGRIARSGIAEWLSTGYFSATYNNVSASMCNFTIVPTVYPDWLTKLSFSANYGYNWYNSIPPEYCWLNVQSSNTTQGLSTINTVRVGKDTYNMEKNMSYINCLAIPGLIGSTSSSYRYLYDLMYVPMPNTSLFAGATIKGLTVGTGDGSTKDFVPYLPIFVKDTDVVKVNGVSLTRGVDYIIDNVHNQQKMYHVSWGHLAEPIQGLSAGYAYVMFRYSSGMLHDGSGNFSNVCTSSQPYAGFSINKPFILKSKNDPLVGNKVNHFMLGGIKTDQVYAGADLRGVHFIFSYSQDNVDYTEAARITVTEDMATTTSSYKWTAGGWGAEVHLDTPIEAQYWKLSVDVSEATVSATRSLNPDTVFRSGQGYNSGSGLATPIRPFIGYVGDYGIRFTNPPSKGAAITMDANVDRPWKDTNHVIDMALQVQFG